MFQSSSEMEDIEIWRSDFHKRLKQLGYSDEIVARLSAFQIGQQWFLYQNVLDLTTGRSRVNSGARPISGMLAGAAEGPHLLPGSPEYFLQNVTRTPNGSEEVSLKWLRDLREVLRSCEPYWVESFLRLGGLKVLLKIVNRTILHCRDSTRILITTKEEITLVSSLVCIRLLLRYRFQEVLLAFLETSETTLEVVVSVFSLNHMKSTHIALDIVNDVAKTTIYNSLLHDAFDLFACLENERALAKRIKEERQTKFSILLRLLPNTAPPTLADPAERRIRNDIWASSLSLINRILTAATDLHDRIELRNDFQTLGIDDTFNFLRIENDEKIDSQIELFEQWLEEDYQEVLSQLGSRKKSATIAAEPASAKGAGSFTILPLVQGSQVFRPVNYPFHPSTTIREVHTFMLQRYKIPFNERDNFGLCIISSTLASPSASPTHSRSSSVTSSPSNTPPTNPAFPGRKSIGLSSSTPSAPQKNRASVQLAELKRVCSPLAQSSGPPSPLFSSTGSPQQLTSQFISPLTSPATSPRRESSRPTSPPLPSESGETTFPVCQSPPPASSRISPLSSPLSSPPRAKREVPEISAEVSRKLAAIETLATPEVIASPRPPPLSGVAVSASPHLPRKEKWLKEENTTLFYGLFGSVYAEFKMKPCTGHILIHEVLDQDIKRDHVWHLDLEFDPNRTAEEFCDYLVTSHFKNKSAMTLALPGFRYALYLPYDSGTYGEGVWLQSAKRISYYQRSNRVMKLQLKLEPLALRIRGMEGGPLETVHVDPRSTVSEVIQLCSRKLGGVLSWSVFSLMKEGGRMEGRERDGTTRFSLLFQEGMKMSQCNPDSILPETEIIYKCVTESDTLRLVRRPKVINVTTPSGKQETITLQPEATHGQTASLVLMELCLREGVKASDFSLFLVSTPSTYGTSTLSSLVERELEPEENLKVEDDAGLVLKKRPSSTQVAERAHASVNIWQEKAEGSLNVDSKGFVSSGTLNGLITRLTDPLLTDQTFEEAFFLTYRNFLTPDDLFAKLLERYSVPSSVKKQEAYDIKQKVVSIAEHWLVACDEDLETTIKTAVDMFLSTSRSYRKSIAKTPSQDSTKKIARAKERKIPQALVAGATYSLITFDEKEFARQISLLFSSSFLKIKPSELLGQPWSKARLRDAKAPNVMGMIDNFNRISMLVTSAIVLETKIRNRVTLLVKFIHLAKHLRKLDNYHALMSVLSGVTSSPVIRLKQTWEKVPKSTKQTLAAIEQLLAPEGSFKSYRQAIEQTTPPAIPYLGVCLQDITFIEDGNVDRMPHNDRLVNFGKSLLLHRVIGLIKKFQAIPYPFVSLGNFEDFLQAIPVLDEKQQFNESQAREARIPMKR